MKKLKEFRLSLNMLETDFVRDIIKLAQKHGTNPNEVLEKAATVIHMFSSMADLTKYTLEEDNK